MKKIVLLFFVTILFVDSVKGQEDLKIRNESMNKISFGVNIEPFALKPIFNGSRYPYFYILNYKRKHKKYNLKSGIEFNYTSRKDGRGKKYVYSGLLGKIGIERVFPVGRRNNFLLGAELVGLTQYWVRYRTYNYGGGISPAWQFFMTNNIGLTTGININITPSLDHIKGIDIMFGRMLFITLDYNF
ncbi:MAG: hypothetical protein H0V01_15600 [Bacteroidetes bacterium]|nr:hypothetical protein [Bacteroidota bacterium]HET6243915.1 hypothetical protein [Bacteroidia bacterium]